MTHNINLNEHSAHNTADQTVMQGLQRYKIRPQWLKCQKFRILKIQDRVSA